MPKPLAYRVVWAQHGARQWKDYPQRHTARGYLIILKAHGIEAWIETITH